jgi:hypothetical protein
MRRPVGAVGWARHGRGRYRQSRAGKNPRARRGRGGCQDRFPAFCHARCEGASPGAGGGSGPVTGRSPGCAPATGACDPAGPFRAHPRRRSNRITMAPGSTCCCGPSGARPTGPRFAAACCVPCRAPRSTPCWRSAIICVCIWRPTSRRPCKPWSRATARACCTPRRRCTTCVGNRTGRITARPWPRPWWCPGRSAWRAANKAAISSAGSAMWWHAGTVTAP